MGSFAGGTRALDVRPHAGLVAPVEGVCSIVGNGLPGGVGMASLLESNDGSVIIGAKGGDSGPVGLEARDVEVNQVDGFSRAIPVRRAGVGASATVKAERAEPREMCVPQYERDAEDANWLGRG